MLHSLLTRCALQRRSGMQKTTEKWHAKEFMIIVMIIILACHNHRPSLLKMVSLRKTLFISFSPEMTVFGETQEPSFLTWSFQ